MSKKDEYDCHEGNDDSCSVQNTRTLGHCENNPLFPHTFKVPVTLAEPTIQVCVEADILLEERALEIKRVLKDVFLEQCKLVPTYNPHVFKLFLSGTIRKNIEYSTVDVVRGSSVCGDIRHTTVHVPWDCCTDIHFPIGAMLPDLTSDYEQRFEFLDKTGMQPQIEKRMFSNFKVFNEQPFCELVKVYFNELDIGMGLDRVNKLEKSFKRLREKIVINLQVKVLQMKQLPIPKKYPCDQEKIDK